MSHTPQPPGYCSRETRTQTVTSAFKRLALEEAREALAHTPLAGSGHVGPARAHGRLGDAASPGAQRRRWASERVGLTLLQGVTWSEHRTRSSVSPPSPQSTLSPPPSAFKAVLGRKEAGQSQKPAMSGPGKGPRRGSQPPVSGGLGPTPNQPWGFGGLAAGAGWSGDPVVLVLGLLASVLAPVFHLPSPDSLSVGFHVPGWEHRVRKDAAASGPLSPCRGSSQLSWWLQLPGSADTHPPLSPATHPSPPPPSLRADHGFWMLLISKLGFPGGSVVKDTPADAGEIRDMGLTPDWEDPLEEGLATHSSILA